MHKIITRTAAGLLAAALLTSPAWAQTYQGVDIAHYAYSVDFQTLKTSGHGQFVYIKTSEGVGWRDPKWQTFTAGAKAAGIPFGYFHYFHSGSDAYAEEQAEVFWNLIKSTGFSLVPAVDVEETDGNDAPVIQSSLRAFVNRFYELSGYKPVIYASTYFVNKFIGSGFTDCLLWQAHYNVSSPCSVSGWGRNYSVWQYDGSNTSVAGVDNTADLDLAANGSIFLLSSAKAEASASSESTASAGSTSTTTGSDVYTLASRSSSANCTAGADFNVYDSTGNLQTGRQVYRGDRLTILSINYARQFAEVEYPAGSKYVHAYIHNLESLLHNDGWHKWQNGSTNEAVYNKSGSRIGTVYPHEYATVLGHASDGRTHILYGTSKGTETKDGYVWYAGR